MTESGPAPTELTFVLRVIMKKKIFTNVLVIAGLLYSTACRAGEPEPEPREEKNQEPEPPKIRRLRLQLLMVNN